MISLLVHYLACFLGGIVVSFLAMHFSLARWRRSKGEHWSERARVLWTARRAMLGVTWGLIFGLILLPHVHPQIPRASYGVLVCMLGSILGTYPSTREIEPRYTPRVWLVETAWVVCVQYAIAFIFIWLLAETPEVMQPHDWMRTVCGLLLGLFIHSGLWLTLVNKLCRQEQIEGADRLDRILEAESARTGQKPRHVWVGRSPVARAVAFVTVNAIAVSDRLLEILDDEELRAVIQHELAHLRESAWVKCVRLAASMSFFVFVFIRPAMHMAGIAGLAVLYAVFVGLTRLGLRTAQRMEIQADRAVNAADENPQALASAIEKIHEANQLPVVMNSANHVHPHAYDRMISLGREPAYRRPDRPGPMAWPGWLALLFPVVLLIQLLIRKF